MPEANTLTKGDIDLSNFEKLGEVIFKENLTENELIKEIENVDAILINKTQLTADVLAHAKKLKYVGECATGFNNIDIEYCNSNGITVTNVPDYSTNAVAQITFAYILNHFSQVAKYNDFVQDNGWINSPTFSPFIYDADELDGKTIGLVGYGKIGRKVAKIADAFGMNVLVYTRSYAKALEASRNSRGEVDRTVLDGFLDRADRFVTYVTLDNLLKHSDIVSVHCPLNKDSENLFDEDTFAKMRHGAFFINTSRGGVLVEDALRKALESGKLSGAAVDVLSTEPMAKDCKLLGLENCTITPHVAWAPFTTRKRLVQVVYENLEAFQKGKPQNIVK